MKILVTNDDGIDSPGIRALAEAMSRVGEVLIVAPDQEQSGVGTARSLHNGIAAAERTSAIEGARCLCGQRHTERLCAPGPRSIG